MRLCRILPLLAALGLAVTGAACSTTAEPSPSGGPGPATASPTGSITVFAAASLTEAFTRIGEDFEASHPGTEVRFNFGSSSALATQLSQGAPADVFAAADDATMARAAAAEAVTAPIAFATNTLAVLVAPGNPRAVGSVRDLARSDLTVVLAAPQVPLGAYTAEVLRRAGVAVTPRSLETDAKAVVAKVVAGEADAAVVYRTDVVAAGRRAEGVAIADALNVTASYPIAVATAAPNPAVARLFVAHVTGPEGRTALEQAGFTAAP